MENKTRQKTSLSRYLWVLPLASLLFLGAIVGLYTYRYQQRFLPGTEIAGVDCSSMTAAEASQALKAAAADSRITLGDSSGEQIAELPLSAFVDDERIEAETAAAFARQKETAGYFDWLMMSKRPVPVAFFRDVTKEQAAAVLDAALYDDQPTVPPSNAKVVLTDDGYEVIPEEPGNQVNMRVCSAALAEALRPLKSLWPAPPAVIAEKALVRPSVTAVSPQITDLTDELDSYLQLSITLDFGREDTFSFTSGDIRSVCNITLLHNRVKCVPDPNKVRAFTDELVDFYGYDGVFAKFRHVEESRPYAYYRVGDNGWIMDRRPWPPRCATPSPTGKTWW